MPSFLSLFGPRPSKKLPGAEGERWLLAADKVVWGPNAGWDGSLVGKDGGYGNRKVVGGF